ncbi:hypothetical protein LTR22_026779 [Elasticomyces elasticus]|nr:hypothetical protein LTR22_026779 [Elasticomyces elasticus]
MAQPTLVLVHGSWHCPEHFELLIPALSHHGYKIATASLPSTQSMDLPPRDLFDDTAAVRDAVLTELSRGNDVVVVAHSYGGCVTNNALEGLNRRARTAAGHKSAVTAIVFLCAAPLPAGTTFLAALGGKPHPVHDFSKSKDFVEVGPPGPGYYFYNDLTPEASEKYSAMLRPQAWVVSGQTTKYTAYVDIPSWYLFTEKDQVLPPPAQRGIVQAAESQGVKLKTASLESSHSPFLSMPEETTDFIVQAAKESALLATTVSCP